MRSSDRFHNDFCREHESEQVNASRLDGKYRTTTISARERMASWRETKELLFDWALLKSLSEPLPESSSQWADVFVPAVAYDIV